MELSWEELDSLLILAAVQRGKRREDMKYGRIESKEREKTTLQAGLGCG